MTTNTTTTKFLPTTESTVIDVPCGECADWCVSHALRVEAGSHVLVRGVESNGAFLVDGIARPMMHGGGVHVTATHTETGVRGRFLVAGCFTR